MRVDLVLKPFQFRRTINKNYSFFLPSFEYFKFIIKLFFEKYVGRPFWSKLKVFFCNGYVKKNLRLKKMYLYFRMPWPLIENAEEHEAACFCVKTDDEFPPLLN